MRSATASTFDRVRPARKTSAPSAANSLATAAPIEPPAPNITARFPCSICESLTVSSVEHRVGDVLAFVGHNKDVRRRAHSTSGHLDWPATQPQPKPGMMVDGYSRYLLACQGLRSTAIVLARPIFRRTFEEYGLP